jgi:hypothetical protein
MGPGLSPRDSVAASKLGQGRTQARTKRQSGEAADLCPMMELRLPPIRDLNLHDDMRQPAHPPPSQGPVVRDERLQKVGLVCHRSSHGTYFAQVLSHCQALCAFADHYGQYDFRCDSLLVSRSCFSHGASTTPISRGHSDGRSRSRSD